MQREIIEEIEEELRNLHTRQLILGFVERLIYGVPFFSNSKSVNIQHLKIRSTLLARAELFKFQSSIKFSCCVIQHAVLAV